MNEDYKALATEMKKQQVQSQVKKIETELKKEKSNFLNLTDNE